MDDDLAWSGTARMVQGAKLLVEISAGSADRAGVEHCSSATRFQAGSISKLVLSAVVLALVQRGKLDLSRPIGRWLGTTPEPWSTITLHHLLSHTSGLGHWGDVPGLPALLAAPPGRDDLVALIRRAPLVDAPGRSWHYSGPGFVMAALAVEAATGAAYGSLAAQTVFAPAAMASTTSGEFPIGRPRVAVGRVRGEPIGIDPGFAHVPGTGDLWTTTGDLLRLNQSLRSGEVLDPPTAARLWTASTPLAPPSTGDAEPPLVAEAYGYGTFIGRVAGLRARFHPGDNPGYQSLLAYLPERDLDLAILCNEDAPAVEGALDDLLRPRPA